MIFANFTRNENNAVTAIIKRANAIFSNNGIKYPSLDIRMDLACVHATYPLRLQEMSEASDTDLMHDMGGIYRCLNRETGKLEHCFIPRFTHSGMTRADIDTYNREVETASKCGSRSR